MVSWNGNHTCCALQRQLALTVCLACSRIQDRVRGCADVGLWLCLDFTTTLSAQARMQGMFAAHAMAGVTDAMAFGFNFELFTHITHFCGRKVVLLGLYNGQGLEDESEEDMVTYSRSTEVSYWSAKTWHNRSLVKLTPTQSQVAVLQQTS